MEIETIKYQRPQSNIVCDNPKCNKLFLKDNSEIRRNKKKNRKNFCSLNCSGKINNGQLKKNGENYEHIKGYAKIDKYTGLREHLNRVKHGGRKQEFDITLDDLLNQWERQKGICPYSGVKLLHPKNAKGKSFIYKASLDRIDSKIGYLKGNIQFISAAANLAKNSMSHEEMIEFCMLITRNWE